MKTALDYIRMGWTQNALARDANNRPLPVAYSPLATKWCAIGAISKAYPGYGKACIEAFSRLRQVIRVFYGDTEVANWNNDPRRTHEEVIAVFKQAGI